MSAPEHSYNGGRRQSDVISRARVNETLFRRSSKGREALAPPGEGGEHVHYQHRRSVGIGCITSRKDSGVTFWEMLAYELGVTVTTAKELWEKGLIK
jgi:hypothetical protein